MSSASRLALFVCSTYLVWATGVSASKETLDTGSYTLRTLQQAPTPESEPEPLVPQAPAPGPGRERHWYGRPAGAPAGSFPNQYQQPQQQQPQPIGPPVQPAFGPGSAPVVSGGLPVVNNAPGAAGAPTQFPGPQNPNVPHLAVPPMTANGFPVPPVPNTPSLPPPQTLSPPPFVVSTPPLSPNISSPPPVRPPPPPPVVLATVSTAASVPAVKASQTLSAYTVDTFTQTVRDQFVATLTANIEALSKSPVQVTIDSVTAGSVKVASTTLFLSGNTESAASYSNVLTSGDVSSVFGTSFGTIEVDKSSVSTTTASNPKSAASAVSMSFAAAATGAAILWAALA